MELDQDYQHVHIKLAQLEHNAATHAIVDDANILEIVQQNGIIAQ